MNAVKTSITFKDFAVLIQSGDIETAGEALALLLNISKDSAARAAQFFQGQLAGKPDLLMQLMQVREDIKANSITEALMKIMTCFNLSGPEALGALESMRRLIPQERY